jgi:xylulokinase
MGGAAARWFADFMEFPDLETVFAHAGRALHNQNPLLFLPHLMGERAPLWDALAKGAFLGLNRDHTIADMAKAVLEGVGFAARLSLESLEESAGFPVAALKLSGGGAKSDLWSQLKADSMDRPLQKLTNLDTGTFGAALIAGVGSGVYPDLTQAGKASVTVEKTFLPNVTKRAYYDDLFHLYQESYQSLIRINQGFSRMRDEYPPLV